MTVITIHMRKNDGLENYLKFFFLFCNFTSGRFCLTPGVRESGCISGRLPDDLGGFTCMVSCLPTQNFLAGLVCVFFLFFLLSDLENDIILSLNCYK